MIYMSNFLRSVLIITLFSGTESGMISSEKPDPADQTIEAIKDCIARSPAPWPEVNKSIRGQVLIILIALTCLHKSCISIYYYASQLAHTPMGRKKYKSYLDYLAESNTGQADAKFKHLCRGWALGTRNFKSALLEKKQIRWIESVGRETEEARHLYWESLLKQLLAYYGKSRSNILSEKKSASWKVMIAYYMKKNTLVSNTWLGEHLYMGRPQGVSQYVSDFGKSKGFETSQYKKMAGRINT